MGCLNSQPSQLGFEEDSEIATISYSRTIEKVNNDAVGRTASLGPSLPWTRRKTKIKKHHNNRLTPSTMQLDLIGGEETSSLSSFNYIDINAITERQRHWNFPKWGHFSKCSFCGKVSHKKVAKAFERGDVNLVANNQRAVPTLGQGGGVCPMAFTNILAMATGIVSVPAGEAVLGYSIALNALDLTAPASCALLKNRKNAWVQLAGHPGSFAPAGPHTIWKKRMTKENNETVAYQALMNDVVKDLLPQFYREVEYNGDFFIEIEDLLQHFHDPSIMDIKMGTRTFLESEVKNPVLRKDLYQKMVKLSPTEPTPKEHEEGAITKLRYMQFREQGSSTATLGFRIEAIRLSGEATNTDLKKLKTRDEVRRTMELFLGGNNDVRQKLIERLKEIKSKFSISPFFKNHELIGSSILIMFDRVSNSSAWMIDFAKTFPVEVMRPLSHRIPWEVGNHEDGYLHGLDNLITIFEEVEMKDVKNTNVTKAQALSNLDKAGRL